MRPIATDTNEFPALRRDGKIYVDKTMFIHRLVTDSDSKLFFMSRPRRFGKSLTVSALKALFQGQRELFKGLYIDKTDWKYVASGNPIWLVGLTFDKQSRRLVDCAATAWSNTKGKNQ